MSRTVFGGLAVLALAARAVPAYSAAVLVESTFDSNDEGWWVGGGTYIHRSTGGNPGGYLEGTDNDGSNVWNFSTRGNFTPEWYLKDFEAAYGGFVMFDLIQLGGDGNAFEAVDVNFWSYQTGSLTYSGIGTPGSQWTHYEVPLVATAGWVKEGTAIAPTEAEMRHILSTFAGLTIRGDHLQTLHVWDTTGLDNVAVTPEPATLSLLALGGVALMKRWRR
jgi:hypothetical protein